MSKRLKLFGLLALVLALAAGAAWAALPMHHLAGTDPNDLPFDNIAGKDQYNTITGDGTLTGTVSNAKGKLRILQITPDAKEVVTIAPRTAHWFGEVGSDDRIQLVVNAAGKVVMKGSNAEVLDNVVYTRYHGGTVLMAGTLGVTNNNALGQRWIGVVGSRSKASAPVFQVEGTDKLQFGEGNDPANAPIFQPFFLIHDSDDTTSSELRYVTVKADSIVSNSESQGLWLHDGLAQRCDAHTMEGGENAADPDTFYSVKDRQSGQFVRLVKQGKATLYINGDAPASELAKEGEGLQNLPSSGGFPIFPGYRLVDGAHHFGGTDVEEGVVEVHAGNAPVTSAHFRGSLGKMWKAFQGSGSTMSSPYDEACFVEQSVMTTAMGLRGIYNPLFIRNDAKVKVNRSQFFSDFNVDKAATFFASHYQLAGTLDWFPQVAVTLDQNDSWAEGTLEGQFNLVLHSLRVINPAAPAPALRPTAGHSQNAAITHDSMAILHVTNAENKIDEKGETLVSNGVLEIAGAKSLGGGQVTIGATGGRGLPDRGFETKWDAGSDDVRMTADDLGAVATLAATNSFTLNNVTVGQPLGAVAVDENKVFTFKDIELQNTGTQEVDTFRINPENVRLGTNYPSIKNVGGSEPFFKNELTADTNRLPDKWRGTVVLGGASGDTAEYKIAGTKSRQTRIDVERGVLQLNAFPKKTADQVARNENPYAIVYLWPKAVLSLAKDLNDFSPYLNVKVTRDSRIRVVLRNDDIVSTQEKARAQSAVFQADYIDYRGLGQGEGNRDRRLVIQIDPSELPSQTIPAGWVKLVYSLDGEGWENTHFLREDSSGHQEDFSKVEVSWVGAADLPIKGAKVVVDQEAYTVYVNFTESITNPVDPNKPTPPAEPQLTATVAPANGSTVKPGETVVFEVKDWKFGDAAVEVENVKWMLNGEDKTADAAGGKLTATAGADGTKLELKVSANVKGEPAKKGEVSCTVNVSSGGTTKPSGDSGSGGGCDAGFSGLALALAAAFLLRRKA